MTGLVTLALAGCDGPHGRALPGPLEHNTQAIELDKAEMVRVEMRMGAGELIVQGGSPKLLDADFAFAEPEQEPTVRYEDGSFRGRLTIAEPSHHFRGAGRYEWKLRLNNEVPLDVVTHLGVVMTHCTEK